MQRIRMLLNFPFIIIFRIQQSKLLILQLFLVRAFFSDLGTFEVVLFQFFTFFSQENLQPNRIKLFISNFLFHNSNSFHLLSSFLFFFLLFHFGDVSFQFQVFLCFIFRNSIFHFRTRSPIYSFPFFNF